MSTTLHLAVTASSGAAATVLCYALTIVKPILRARYYARQLRADHRHGTDCGSRAIEYALRDHVRTAPPDGEDAGPGPP